MQTGLRSDIMDTMPPSRSVRSTGRSQKLVGYLQVGQSHYVDAIFCPKTSMNITHEWGSYAPRGERAARTRTLIYLAPVTIAILAHREERDLDNWFHVSRRAPSHGRTLHKSAPSDPDPRSRALVAAALLPFFLRCACPHTLGRTLARSLCALEAPLFSLSQLILLSPGLWTSEPFTRTTVAPSPS